MFRLSSIALVLVLAINTISSSNAFTTSFIGNSSPVAHRAPVNTKSALCMKTIAVFGASGLTASECVYQALKDGYDVVGLTRNPANLKIPEGSGGSNAGKAFTEPNLTVIGGDVTNAADVAKVFEAADIDGVVIALGGKTKDVGETMCTDGTVAVMDAMKTKGVKRVSIVSSIGVGDSIDQAPFFFRILMATAMSKIFTDKNNQEAAIEASGLEFCIVRPGGLNVEAPTGIVNVIDGEAGSIARADVARFCLDAICMEDFPYLGQAPCISSVGGTGWVKDRSAAARGDMA